MVRDFRLNENFDLLIMHFINEKTISIYYNSDYTAP